MTASTVMLGTRKTRRSRRCCRLATRLLLVVALFRRQLSRQALLQHLGGLQHSFGELGIARDEPRARLDVVGTRLDEPELLRDLGVPADGQSSWIRQAGGLAH